MLVLSRDERLKLDSTCDLILSNTLEALAGFNGTVDDTQWQAIGQREQLTLYRSVQSTAAAAITSPKGSNAGKLRLLATGYLNSSLANVTSGLYCDTSLDLNIQQCILHSPSSSAKGDQESSCPVIDASVLHVAERESRRTSFQFAGVKWCAWKTKDGERDLLAYERSGRTVDNGGQEIVYHIVQSIGRPYTTNVKFPPGLRRMKLSMCFLYREVCEDLVECFAVGEYPARGSGISQRAEDAAVSDRILTVAKALSAYSAKKLSKLIERNKNLPILMSKSCLRCGARRTVFDQLRNCGICKKSVCQRCRKEKTIFKLNIDTKKPEKEVFCGKCLKRANLPNTRPVSLEKMKQHQQLANRERSSEKRHSDSGGRESMSTSSSSSSSAKTKANTTPAGYNYDALFRNSAAQKAVRTRVRASTLPSSMESGNRRTDSQQPVVPAGTPPDARPASSAVAGIEVDLAEGEVVAESLRGTQIGVPVVLVDMRALRETQLGMPVEIETGRLSQPELAATPITSRASCPAVYSQMRSSLSMTSPPSSPRSSDLYFGVHEASSGRVERLYHTYLDCREKQTSEATGEQRRQSLRMTISHGHRQHQQEHQEHPESALAANRSTVARTNENKAANQTMEHATKSVPIGLMPPKSDRPEACSPVRAKRSQHREAPQKQNFHMDLYAAF